MAIGDPTIQYSRDLRWRTGSADRLERAAERGEFVRVGWGAYASVDDWEHTSAEARLRTRALAVRAAARSEPVFSHETAAAFLGLPIVGTWPERPTATVSRGGSESNGWVRRVRREAQIGDRIRLESGVLVTSVGRTALDLAGSRSLLSGIVTVSHARRHAGVQLSELDAAIDRLGGAPGAARSRRAVARSTSGSDSPLESLVIARCQDLGFEMPTQQVPVVGSDGVEYRCDFAWMGGTVIGEADGRIKYIDDAFESGSSGAEVLWREKRREDAIRAVRPRFMRFDWQDAWRGAGLERALLTAGVPRPRRPQALTY